jgi:hypothetical protein
MAINSVLLAPGDKALNPMTIPGTTRRYTCAAGAVISVPEFDAEIMRTQGWVKTHAGTAGTTSGRPTNAGVNQFYLDTTLGAQIVYLGPKAGWVNAATGASA